MFDLPLPDGESLDLPVCVQHHREIEADPSGWQVTSMLNKDGRERVAVVRMEGS